jgi:hypothetical protein
VTAASDARAAAAIAQRTAALLRDARPGQRRLDTLAANALATDDPSLPQIAVAREAVPRLVVELAYRESGEQRRTKGGGAGSDPGRHTTGGPPSYRSV